MVPQPHTEQQRISFTFNASTLTPGPFAAQLIVANRLTGERYNWENPQFNAKNSQTIGIPQLTRPAAYTAQLTFDGTVAFAGTFTPKVAF